MSVESAKKDIQIGDEMEDGTILAGYYEGKPLYTTQADAPGGYNYRQAEKYAKNVKAHGLSELRMPNKGELNVLYENRNKGKLKGTFNQTGAEEAGYYWSSSRKDCMELRDAWAQKFSDGLQTSICRKSYDWFGLPHRHRLSVRLVR